MDYLNCAASMNNMGVVSMLMGNRREAFDFFRSALESLCERVAYCTPTYSSNALSHHFSSLHQTNLPFVPVSFDTSSLSPEAPAYTFTKAFIFNTYVVVLEEYLENYKAVILFNLALLYDKGEQGTARDEFEATALNFYNSSLEILQCPTSPLDCSNVVIALLNNKAQIFFRRNEVENTRASLEELGKSLNEALGEGTKALDEHDINGLLLNVHCQSALVCAPGA